jgi:dTMP kinase
MWLGPRLLEGFSRRRLFGLSITCAGGFLVLIALVPSLVAAVVFTLAVGACGGLAWVTGYTLLGLEVDDEVRGRTFAFLQSAARVVLVLVLALGPAIAAPIGTHTIHVARGFTLTYNGAAWVFLLAGVVAVVLGLTAYREMDDRKGVPLIADLLSAWRGRALAATSPASRRRPTGYLIAFEGGDGAGKSTQAALLAEWLREDQGHEVVLTREPGATPLGVRLRELLLSRDETLDPRTEALLFAADRADHVATVVRPAMERGAVVVTDRYVDSSIAYQGAGRDLDSGEIAQLSRFATDGLVPDLTVLLDIPSEFSRVRRAYDPKRQGDDRLEALPEEFHERVRARFLALAAAEPHRYLVLDGTLPREEVQELIRARVRDVVPISSRLRSELTERLVQEEALRRRRADAEADVLRLDNELRGRQRDESRARVQTRRRLREEVERELELEAQRRRQQPKGQTHVDTQVLDVADPRPQLSDPDETLRP